MAATEEGGGTLTEKRSPLTLLKLELAELLRLDELMSDLAVGDI